MIPSSRIAAPRRADAIGVFREELERLDAEGTLRLTAA